MTGGSFTCIKGVLLHPRGPSLSGGAARGQWQVPSAPPIWRTDNICRLRRQPSVQNPDKHPMEDLARLIAARGQKTPRIGFEARQLLFHRSAFLTLQTTATGVNIQTPRAGELATPVKIPHRTGIPCPRRPDR